MIPSLAAGSTPGRGENGWSEAAFAPALPPDIALDLSLTAASLDLGAPIPATDAKLDFSLSGGVLNIDLAGEFIVMAANLMYLKSRMLIPKQVQPPEEDADEEEERAGGW